MDEASPKPKYQFLASILDTSFLCAYWFSILNNWTITSTKVEHYNIPPHLLRPLPH